MKKIFLILFFITSCATRESELISIRDKFDNKDYKQLENKENNTLDLLISAQASFQNNNFEKSDLLFEKFHNKNINPVGFNLLSETAVNLFGHGSSDYKPYMMDYLFAYYYQILNNFFLKKQDTVRVIINQSYDKQKQMAGIYSKLITKKQDYDINNHLENNYSHWKAYRDIVNPALTYLSGIYYLNNSEFENARQYLSRTKGMMPDNSFVNDDLSLSEKKIKPENTAWIFIEDGYAPNLSEKRIDIPWNIDGKVQLISITTSIPKFNFSKKTYKNSELILDTDSLFLTEFKEYKINNAVRSFAKALTNYTVQKIANSQNYIFGSLIGNIYTYATTNSETRSWLTLPKYISVIKKKIDKTGLIKLNQNVSIKLDPYNNYLIYIRDKDIKKIKI